MNYAVPDWAVDAHALPNDRVVHLAQMAAATAVPLTLLVLHEAPGWRYQLQANGLTRQAWWQVFDAIQGIHISAGLPLDSADVILPAGSDLVYNGDFVLIMQGDTQIGTISRHPQGFVWRVTWMLPGGQRVDQYDDRGFLSTQTWQDVDGQPVRKTWLDVTGAAVLTQTDQIQVAPRFQARFAHAHYPDIAAVVREYTRQYFIDSMPAETTATLVTAASQDFAVLASAVPANVARHFFVADAAAPALPQLAPAAASLITPTAAAAAALKQRLQQIPNARTVPVQVIPPFSTALHLGRSNEVAAVTIYWHVNGLAPAQVSAVFLQFLTAMAKNDDYAVVVDGDDSAQIDQLQTLALNFAAKTAGIPLDSALYQRLVTAMSGEEEPEATPVTAETEMTETDEQKAVATAAREQEAVAQHTLAAASQFLQRLTYAVQTEYSAVPEAFQTVRLLVDLGLAPDLFMQIAAISAGIPQINQTETGYVTDGENGRLISSLSQTGAAAAYYLDSLDHWNAALVANARRIEQYSETHTQELWEEVLAHGQEEKAPANRVLG